MTEASYPYTRYIPHADFVAQSFISWETLRVGPSEGLHFSDILCQFMRPVSMHTALLVFTPTDSMATSICTRRHVTTQTKTVRSCWYTYASHIYGKPNISILETSLMAT